MRCAPRAQASGKSPLRLDAGGLQERVRFLGSTLLPRQTFGISLSRPRNGRSRYDSSSNASNIEDPSMLIVNHRNRPIIHSASGHPSLSMVVNHEVGARAMSVWTTFHEPGELVPLHTHEYEEIIPVIGGEAIIAGTQGMGTSLPELREYLRLHFLFLAISNPVVRWRFYFGSLSAISL